ncbi:MAG: PcfJ domain-containing protein [Candidatus Competibacterales bacterium]
MAKRVQPSIQRVPPPEPRLAVGRRTLSSLVRDSAVWHARFHHYQRREILTWGARGLGLALPQGRFEELTSSADLGHEGEALGHCVATYAAECHAGRAAIVAYRPPLAKPGNRLTLEIDVRHLRLAQVRGQRNRLPTAAEWTVLEAWAKQTKISIPGDLRHPPTPI